MLQRRELTGLGECVQVIGMAARNRATDPLAMARHRGLKIAESELVTRAAEGAIATGSDGLDLSKPVASATIGQIARNSLSGYMLENARPAGSFHERILATDTAKTAAGIIDEAVGVPVSNTSASSIYLVPGKVGSIIVYPVELLTDPAGLAVIERDFAECAQRGLDAAILATLPGDSNNSFSATAQPMSDMNLLLSALGDQTGVSPPVLAANSATLIRMATLRDAGGQVFPEVGLHGGYFAGCGVFASDVLNDGVIRALAPEAILFKAEGVEVSASTEVALQMDSAPTVRGDKATASTAVSMFQNGSVAVRFLISYAVIPLRDTVASEMDGCIVAWS